MNTRVVDVPFEVVSVTRTVYSPGFANTWVVVGVVVVVPGVPSPKSHAYEAICPNATVDVEALNDVADPAAAIFAVSFATGAWSGTTAMPRGLAPAVNALPASCSPRP